jgi:hypothetical protein
LEADSFGEFGITSGGLARDEEFPEAGTPAYPNATPEVEAGVGAGSGGLLGVETGGAVAACPVTGAGAAGGSLVQGITTAARAEERAFGLLREEAPARLAAGSGPATPLVVELGRGLALPRVAGVLSAEEGGDGLSRMVPRFLVFGAGGAMADGGLGGGGILTAETGIGDLRDADVPAGAFEPAGD